MGSVRLGGLLHWDRDRMLAKRVRKNAVALEPRPPDASGCDVDTGRGPAPPSGRGADAGRNHVARGSRGTGVR